MDDAERITRALRRRGAKMLCPSCQFPLRGPIGDYRLEPAEATRGKGIKAMVYACGNCGYLRLHSANVLDDAAG